MIMIDVVLTTETELGVVSPGGERVDEDGQLMSLAEMDGRSMKRVEGQIRA